MQKKHKRLLAIDAIVNVVLGGLLLLFPAGVVELLGLPETSTLFYASILGAVILGIGIALLLELPGRRARVRGLGLGGAIAINLCGGGALVLWLVAGPLELPLRGTITLWAVAVLVLGIGGAEIASRSWVYDEAPEQAGTADEDQGGSPTAR